MNILTSILFLVLFKGNKVYGSNNQPVVLAGMSLFWSQWSEGSVFYTANTVQSLKCNWNANVVRAAMGVENGGYLTNPSAEQAKVETVIKAAIAQGIYVIVDWHDHNAQNHVDQAINFFTYIAKTYGSNPNIIYETFNEPLQIDWSIVKSYHEKVVAAIRKYDKKNLIVLGTTTWSQDVDIAAANPGVCIFVTEYGTVDASGGGSVDVTSSNQWWSFLDSNKISYANWALDNKAEAAAALTPGTTPSQVGDDSRLTASGKLVKNKLKSMKNGISCSG
uniref:Glycoside hydrolase family 5 domain-containing protein n=1 Tax=Meloidogyne javanica TaxID=6303 RepID=A0A915MX30_MELJA